MTGSPSTLPAIIRTSIPKGQSVWINVLMRGPDNTVIDRDHLGGTWQFKIYDGQVASEETAVYSATALALNLTNSDGSAIIPTTTQTSGLAWHPDGFTFNHFVDFPTLLGAALKEHTYLYSARLTMLSGGAVKVRALISMTPEHST